MFGLFQPLSLLQGFHYCANRSLPSLRRIHSLVGLLRLRPADFLSVSRRICISQTVRFHVVSLQTAACGFPLQHARSHRSGHPAGRAKLAGPRAQRNPLQVGVPFFEGTPVFGGCEGKPEGQPPFCGSPSRRQTQFQFGKHRFYQYVGN